MRSLDQTSFSEIAERLNAKYHEKENALLLGMLGQEYVVRHDGIFLHGQPAPETHAAVILDYVFSSGTILKMLPWRAIGGFAGLSVPEFRTRVEIPVTSYAPEIIARANVLLPMLAAKATASFIGSDMAIDVQALPNVYLHAELSQENGDFPAEIWILFSNNASEFVTPPNLLVLAELFKDRLLSLLRIY